MEARKDRGGVPQAFRDERGHAFQGREGDQAYIRDRADGGIPRCGREIPDAAEHDERESAGNIVSEIITGEGKGEISMKLYELTEQYDEVMNLLYDGETDEQTILDTLESIEGEIEDKADNYAKIIKTMTAEAEAIKSEEDRIHKRRMTLENRAKWLKDTLQANLEFIGKTKFKTELFSFSVSSNGGKRPLVITDNLGEIPGKYLIPQDPVVDKDAVRELLKDKEVEWAKLEPYGKHLNIR